MIRYGLLHIPSGKLLGVSTQANNSDFCVDVCFTLDEYVKSPWLVEKAEEAAMVRKRKGDWFNAGYESPLNPFNPSDLKVVKVSIEFE